MDAGHVSDLIDLAVQGFIAAAALVGALAAIFTKRKKDTAEKELNRAHNELSHRAEAISFERFMHEWADIQREVVQLFEETNIDRFIMLRAWNGATSPKWTTAFLQLRAGVQQPYSYINVELDDDYIDRLKRAINQQHLVFRTADIVAPSLVKQIYDAEGVKSSAWFHIANYDFDEGESRAIMYCSFATHSDEEIDSRTLTRARMIVFRLKALANEDHRSK